LFYAADPARLRQDVDSLLASPAFFSHRPKALITPHAGYVYSGATAGKAFALLRGAGGDITRVVVIGPAHYVALRGIAIPTVGAFETPLGPVEVDRDALMQLNDLPFVRDNDAAHAPEHALEVELPFLQMALGQFRLVPLVVGEATPTQAAAALQRLWGGSETLVVISSDLSHYHDYETARRLDAATGRHHRARRMAAAHFG
jgi:AmmeMemoRadiSam system protein B